MAREFGTMWVCICCMLCHANGECCGDDDNLAHDREPWNKVNAMPGFAVTMGILESEHNDQCTPEDREEGCGCAVISFTWSSCEGCGSTLGGERHAFTLWSELAPANA